MLMKPKISVVVIDDHPLFRDGVIHVLNENDAFAVVGQGASADEAVSLVSRHAPDVVLLDVMLPGGGVELVRRLREAMTSVRILLLTIVDDREFATLAFREGVRGYLLKGAGADELLSAVKAVSRDEFVVAPPLLGQLLGHSGMEAAQNAQIEERGTDLSERETQVLDLLSRGMSNKEIAFRLTLSEKTVKYYLTHLLRKLKMRNRVEAAIYAVQHSPRLE